MGSDKRVYQACLLADAGRTLRYASPEACVALGKRPDELLGADAGETLAGRTVNEYALPGGETLLVLLEESTVADELRQANFDLEQALRAANAANEAKSSFLSNMSHDIRTPMNAIIGMTDIALNHLDERGRVQDCLKKIQTASQHLMSLINDVLDMSRIDSGKTTINEDRFSLADLVHDLVVLLRPLAESKDQRLTLDTEDITHELLMGDVLYLRQVFVNIVNNAIKYTPEGGHIQVRFAQRPGEGDRRVLLEFTCRDDGIGMTGEFLQRIFLPFERAQNTTLGKVEGTGLGMTITRSLVEQMGGSIRVESEPGMGSTFTVTLPLSTVTGEEVAAPLTGKRVLLVEKDAAQAALVAGYLHQSGGEVVQTATDTETVAWVTQAEFEGGAPSAVVLGSGLGFNALLDLATHLRNQLGPQVPILLMSEQDWSQIEYVAKRSGISAFVPCPVFRGRLIQALCSGEEEPAPAAADFSGMRILLAEDNALNREIALELIGETGAQVDAVENGLQALETFAAAEEGCYDLVLMDIQMPVMDGYEAVRRIRALPRADARTVTIAAMTANAFVEDIKKSRAAGMDEHLSKPVDIRQIEELMRRCRR